MAMRNGLGRILLAISLMPAWSGWACAITISIDYRYDATAQGGSNFFGSGNPQGPLAGTQARMALEAAAAYYSEILNDSFLAISVPAPYESSISDGTVSWEWSQQFDHPSTGADLQVRNATIVADQYVIYAGALGLASPRAIGSPGEVAWQANISGTNSFSAGDINRINSVTNRFREAVERRGEESGFARWGGTISFDTAPGSRMWHFDHTVEPSANTIDFYSVAIDGLAHVLGFSDTTEWRALVSGSVFLGAHAAEEYGGPVPLSPDLSHWAAGTSSVIFGTSIAQESAMNPSLQAGTRRHLTVLDAAALADIGWEVVPEPATIQLAWLLSVLVVFQWPAIARPWRT